MLQPIWIFQNGYKYASGHSEYKRHMSVPEDATSITQCSENNVLKKVASLTLSKADLESKITKPKFVPEKLDFQLYEKFEGYMLVNWYISELSENHPLGRTLSETEFKLLAVQFCTHLLAAGVLRQIRDKDAPMCNVFKPDCMYYWTYAEHPQSVPQTPGRISMVSWPPTASSPSEVIGKILPSDTIISSSPRTPDEHLERQASPENDNQVPSFKNSELRSSARDVEILSLEDEIKRLRQEVDKYKTLVEIQTLTANAVKDFGSPIDESKNIQSICDSKNSDNNVIHTCRNKQNEENCSVKNNQSRDSSTETFYRSVVHVFCQTDDTLDFRDTVHSNSETQTVCSAINSCVSSTPNDKKEVFLGSALPVMGEPPPSTSSASNLLPTSTPVDKMSELQLVNTPVFPILNGQCPIPSPCALSVNGLCSPSSTFSPLSGCQVPFAPGAVPATQFPPATFMPSGFRPPPPPPMPMLFVPIPPPMPGVSLASPTSMPGMTGLPPPNSAKMIGPHTPSMLGHPQLSMSGMSGPPPPPMPCLFRPPLPPPMPGMMGPPPPPPPPPLPGVLATRQLSTTDNAVNEVSVVVAAGGPPPPPPPPPGGKLCSPKGPAPLPTPPPGGWSAHKAALRKTPLNPKAPMKPLYWTRIIAPPQDTVDANNPALWNEIDELSAETLDEFSELFSRQIVTRKPSSIKKVEQKAKFEAVKLLDSKRSQNVGILAQSLHIDFQEIENAIYNFDTSIVSLESLQQIYEARGTRDEMELIKNHLTTKPDVPLDKPEMFLHELSEISNFAERISCLMFMVEFEDSINTISHTLTNIKTTCEYLMTSKDLKSVMAIILTLGNYMNGGNVTRGQADGFGLEILGKLKDVKSKDSKITLLHYIVRMYLKSIENPFDLKLNLPIPQPEDIRRAASVNFDDVNVDLQKLQKQLEGCEDKSRKVIEASHPENLQPFKDKMTTFLEHSKKQLSQEHDNLEECRSKFILTMKFYLFRPKTGTLETFPPNSFFELWLSFCIDFKDIFKKEIIRMEAEKMQELRKKENEIKSSTVKTKERQNGLKAKVKRYQQKLS